MTALTSVYAESIYDHKLKDIDGKQTSLAEHKGKVILMVNVASKCGFTRQYKALEELHQKYKDKGFVVLGFPCNQFFGQEPGSNAEIAHFCSSKYDVTFPMFAKLDVKGKNQHPLFAHLTGESSPKPGKVSWNFNKFIVGRSGLLVQRFGSMSKPEGKNMVAAIERELEK